MLISQGPEELDLEQPRFKGEGPEELDLLNPDSPALDLLHIMVFLRWLFFHQWFKKWCLQWSRAGRDLDVLLEKHLRLLIDLAGFPIKASQQRERPQAAERKPE